MKKQSIKLYPAVSEDKEFLLSLRNDPWVRKFAFNTQMIEETSHRKWFHMSLEDPRVLIFIATINQQPIGQIRFNITNHDTEAEISIAVVREKRGLGYGYQLLCSGCDYLIKNTSVKKINAYIKLNNAISQKLFAKCNFINTGLRLYKWHLCYKFSLAI